MATKACIGFLLLILVLDLCAASAEAKESGSGVVMLVGEVLGFQHRKIWQRVSDLAGGDAAEFVVISAAHERPALYGGYAVRALQRYGPFVELLPLADSPEEFDTHARRAVIDPELVKQVRRADGVFFVGGVPQRLARVLLNNDGSDTPLAAAIRHVYTEGGVIIGGIPGSRGGDTGLDTSQVLKQGGLSELYIHGGLGLIDDRWYVDQYLFSAGHFVQTLAVMRQLGQKLGIGVGANAAAEIKDGRLQVLGSGGVMIIDLTAATTVGISSGLNIQGVSLSLLDDGDVFDLNTLQLLPHSSKLDGIEIRPDASNQLTLAERGSQTSLVLTHSRFLQLLLATLDGERRQAMGSVVSGEGSKAGDGYQVRFYTGRESKGWLATDSADNRYTISKIYMDYQVVMLKRVVD